MDLQIVPQVYHTFWCWKTPNFDVNEIFNLKGFS